MKESRTRSAVKSATYRLFGITSSTIIVYILSGRVDVALESALVLELIHTAWYFTHERLWSRIRWGYGKS